MQETRMEYPRPQLRRDDWFALNGEWEFAFDDGDGAAKYEGGRAAFPMRIRVPFSYQYETSGIGDRSHHGTVWYRRTFPDRARGRRTLLCFNAADYETDVWINGRHAAHHAGGFTPFTADITPYVRRGENTIVVRCRDPLDPAIPRGKQSWTGEPFGCWYVPNTGIWQSVWLEYCAGDGLARMKLVTDVDAFALSVELETMNGRADRAELIVSLCGKTAKRCEFSLDPSVTRHTLRLSDGAPASPEFLWTPEHPSLFGLDIVLYEGGKESDRVHTRFGMRKIEIDGRGRILLNGAPLYQRLVLDQGYWPESGLTPPRAEALKEDIALAKRMGFNGARKHQKLEDPYYYYYAEELGFLVWCEMPSAYAFCSGEMGRIAEQWREIVVAARNFTSVICYVPLNESWGVSGLRLDADCQNFARSLYYATKALDGTRLVSTNDGWENPTETDIVSIHDYAETGCGFAQKYRDIATADNGERKIVADGNEYRGQPVLFTEWGGIAMDGETGGGNWGYNSGAADAEEFYSRYENLVKGIAACDFQGYCYTQLTDVQQEVNGLLRADRTPKFDMERLRKLNSK